MADEIDVDTKRYVREHGHEPQGRRFWRFTILSPSITTRDHYFDPGKAMTYEAAVEDARRVAGLRRSTQIVVEP